MRRQTTWLWLISSVLTFLVIRTIIVLLPLDIASAVIPGWHTTISPTGATYFTLVLMLITYGISRIFQFIYRLLQNGFKNRSRR
ncbi:MAG: hypothetical protein ACK4TA_23405 [Saprospiraceae bacterium]